MILMSDNQFPVLFSINSIISIYLITANHFNFVRRNSSFIGCYLPYFWWARSRLSAKLKSNGNNNLFAFIYNRINQRVLIIFLISIAPIEEQGIIYIPFSSTQLCKFRYINKLQYLNFIRRNWLFICRYWSIFCCVLPQLEIKIKSNSDSLFLILFGTVILISVWTLTAIIKFH